METTTQILMVSYIGKCPVKGCKCVLRRDVPGVMRNRSSGYPYQRAVMKLEAVYTPNDQPVYCAQHRRQIWFKRIDGKISDVHVCDARCLNATGPNCECSCGGANHGKNHCC